MKLSFIMKTIKKNKKSIRTEHDVVSFMRSISLLCRGRNFKLNVNLNQSQFHSVSMKAVGNFLINELPNLLHFIFCDLIETKTEKCLKNGHTQKFLLISFMRKKKCDLFELFRVKIRVHRGSSR